MTYDKTANMRLLDLLERFWFILHMKYLYMEINYGSEVETWLYGAKIIQKINKKKRKQYFYNNKYKLKEAFAKQILNNMKEDKRQK